MPGLLGTCNRLVKFEQILTGMVFFSQIFIYKAEYRGGPVIPSEDNSVLDYAWVTPKELRQYLGRTTSRVLNKFIIY